MTELDDQKAILVAVAASQPGTSCPVCGGPVHAHVDAQAVARAKLDELTDLKERHAAAVQAHRLAVDAHRTAVRLASAADDAKRELDRALAENVPADPGVDVETAARRLRKILDLRAAARADGANRHRALVRIETLIGELESVNAVLVGEPGAAEVEAAAAFVADAERVKARRTAGTVKADVLRQSLAASETAAARVASIQAAAAGIESHRTVVKEVIEVMHRDGAPAQAARSALQALTADINVRLNQIRADYAVEVDVDGEVWARFSDGSPRRRASILSPGQQMVLALAWRVAIVDRYSPRAGVICLDEPTTGLDEPRISALRCALDAWRLTDNALQFLIVTHDRRLYGAFDQRIEL